MAQSPIPFEVDDKNNPILVTIFESYLGKFIIEHPDLYKDTYIQLLSELKAFIDVLNDQRRVQRDLYSIFSTVQEHYQGYDSFDSLLNPDTFNLSACEFFLKHIGDYFVIKGINVPTNANKDDSSPKSNTVAHLKIFVHTQNEGRGSPTNYLRNQLLFHEDNRGVLPLPEISEIEPSTTLGIVSREFCPPAFINYFSTPIEPAGVIYHPKEDSYVAKYLRQFWCPVISGASGSTETLYNRILSICSFDIEKKQLILFVQACNMIANGHHSLFEAMLVAHDLGFKLMPKQTLQAFYLQCVPRNIKEDAAFIEFMASDAIIALQLDTEYTDSFDCEETLDSTCSGPKPYLC